MPPRDSALTQAQVNHALNIQYFQGSVPAGGRAGNWHEGQFEPWALQFGYPGGMPLYAHVNPGNYHIYWLNDGHQAPIILMPGQTPADYQIYPN
ncbi:MAG: hypothetical protein R3B09_30515 [Nannocystaceae bacterium]